uniref:Uncharacterized protein n=1 Tax=Lepeophtheirus salmonis TaxID=72036 RepID=A0A0K2U0N1_LEPSM
MPEVIKDLKGNYEVSNNKQKIQILTIFVHTMIIRLMMQNFKFW